MAVPDVDSHIDHRYRWRADSGNVNWHQTGGTTTALTVTGTLTDLNAYFNTASNIQYQHGTADLNGDNADTIQINVNDNGNTGSGGGSDVDLGTGTCGHQCR